ncbi:hypothetical protein JR316_0001342 [Psilocybe cubensis]|uniref:Uncharacterized protein n=2 Tax=Psilocybe cubensis TaxID=181762 RepID=A0ACB8HHV0_PSICU|nr:hypothetical protein JR316_0001342 [Psilocybe cubensis]KAH9487272.1 hypothetical protein JR316_0001342 [Psilocybe cubensis]
MSFEEEDTFQFFLHRAFNANYNPDLIQSTVDQPSEPMNPPFTFYDRHLGSDYILHNVVHTPFIPQLLSKICDVSVNRFITSGHKFSATGYIYGKDIPGTKFKDASGVRDYYATHVGDTCQAYLSKLCVHPEVETWPTVIRFREHDKDATFYMAEGHLAVCEAPSGGVFWTQQDELPKSTTDTLNVLLDTFPRLAMWHVFPMVDTFTRTMQNSVNDTKFKWEPLRTAGYRFKTRVTLPPDGTMLSNLVHVRRVSRRKIPGGHLTDRNTLGKAGKFVTTPTVTKRKRYRPDFRHYLQHAWSQAAIHDTTFLVLNCGRYERIGIRHRASRTLYLSGLIDTVNSIDPRYRKLHIGLYIAIFQDALERMSALNAPSKSTIAKKRSLGDDEEYESPRSKKRRKTGLPTTLAHESISVQLVDRKLALVSLDYDAFCSPVPSSFIRIGESCKRHSPTVDTDWTKGSNEQKKFNSQEYFTLKLSAPLGHGAIGVVHPAQAEVALQSGGVLKENLAFKLAFTEEQQARLKNEFEIYCRMSRATDIEGILDVHGLFFDAESNVMGLLMANGGITLRQREIERTGAFAEQVKTTAKEKDAFKRALQSIHNADIRHQDIRADNLTVTPDGRVFIIDFDCAEWASPDSLTAEALRLNEILEGKYKQRLLY